VQVHEGICISLVQAPIDLLRCDLTNDLATVAICHIGGQANAQEVKRE
jgi:hypothetical protein